MGYIYVYTKESYRNSSDAALHDRVKIGFTFRIPEQRVKEQDTTSDDSPLILLKAWKISDSLGEFDVIVHHVLEKQGYKRTRYDVSREWYIIPATSDIERLTIIHEAIQIGAKDPDTGRIDLELTPSQYEMLEMLLDRFDAGDSTVIAELCARFGKTLWALCVLLSRPESVLVVAAYWLSALTSFRYEVTKFNQFSNFCYVDANESNYFTRVKQYLDQGHKVVVGVSLCGSSDRRELKKEDLSPIVEYNNKIVFVDEADYGAWQVKQRDLVDYLCSK